MILFSFEGCVIDGLDGYGVRRGSVRPDTRANLVQEIRLQVKVVQNLESFDYDRGVASRERWIQRDAHRSTYFG